MLALAATVQTTAMADGLANADFEAGEAGWDFSAAQGTARVSAEAAFAGWQGMRIESTVRTPDAQVTSARMPVEAGVAYRLSWQARVRVGLGTNVYLRFHDAAGKVLHSEEGRINNDKQGAWTPAHLNSIPPAGATTMEVVMQRPNWRPAEYAVDVDNFALVATPLVAAAPWPGTYKLRPDETARLTAADVPGPDGRIYPDFTWAGVPGGIPNLPVKKRLADMGVRDGDSIAALLEQTASEVAAAGGGVIELGAGTFYLDEPVMFFGDGVAIRGAGRDKTRLMFRYHVPYGEVRFFRLTADQQIDQGSVIEIHANPRDLVALELKVGGRSLSRKIRADHWGNTFTLRIGGGQALNLLGEGNHVFTAIAEYANGDRAQASMTLRIAKGQLGEPAPSQLGALNFVGRGSLPEKKPLVANGRRGDRTIRLALGHGLKSGDKISLVAPASERWRAIVGHTSHWQIQAQNLHEVVSVAGSEVTVNQPLRTEFLVEDGAHVTKFRAQSMGGVESLHLEQVVVPGQPPPGPRIGHTLWHAIDDLWTTGIHTENVWGFWMRDLTLRNVGRNSAYFLMSKHVEVRNCLFDEAIFKGGGGTGYVGFDRTWDSLMDGVETRGMRHAPNVQWNASGNVVRNSRFLGSDGQWHAGWTLENLYENNFIDARGDGGSYGHGLYASGPSSGVHGPQGPRNVVYNNDVVARKDCLHMLGGNEAWLILHNRLVTDQGRAVFAKEKSFDHVIAGNLFVLRRAQTPAIFLGVDSVGVELVDNTIYGALPPLVGFAGGLTTLALDRGNNAKADVPERLPDRPQPAVPSLYQWQLDHLSKIRAWQEAAPERARAAKSSL